MEEKTFNLTWNNHLANLSGLFEALYKSGSLTDTTLSCQGGMLRAHRLVLAACSPYFERVFKEHHGEQPILILRGIAIEEMECLLDFMYRGSINVAEEHLASLIRTATELEIRGLSGDHASESNNVNSRVESRDQPCQVEATLNPEFRKAHAIPFLSKSSSGSPPASHVKMEEIEVEDDPMIMEGNEDSFEEPLPLAKEPIRHLPPPMFKRYSRFDGSKRGPSRITKDNEDVSRGHQDSDGSYNESGTVKSQGAYNNSQDPTVPAIQMNEDSMDHGRSHEDSPIHVSMEEITNRSEIKPDPDSVKYEATNPAATTKERRATLKNKAQYKPFTCDLCTLAFTRASHLARHRRVHTGERPFACNLCPRMFARQDKLKQHLDSHLQWPKRRSSGVGGTQPQAQPQLHYQHTASNLIGKGNGKRGRPRKVSMGPTTMDEILKFGEFSSMLNKSSYSTNKNGGTIEYDQESREDEGADSKSFIRLHNPAPRIGSAINME